MKLINCPKHGEVQAIVIDSLLLRYKCSHCFLEESEDVKQIKSLTLSLFKDYFNNSDKEK